MTFQDKLNKKIAQAQEKVQEAREEALNLLLENDSYIETQRSLACKDNELKALEDIIIQLNAIVPFKAKAGDKFSINVFPVNGFPTGLDKLLGIITGSRSAFVDELSLQYEAITGVSMIELTLANQALGSPSYFNAKTNTVSEELPSNLETLNSFLKSIALKLNIVEFNTEVTQAQLDLWFMKSKIKAETAKAEFEKNVVLNATTNFTIED